MSIFPSRTVVLGIPPGATWDVVYQRVTSVGQTPPFTAKIESELVLAFRIALTLKDEGLAAVPFWVGMSASTALTGTLEERPLAMLLAVAAERVMTGTFTLGRGENRAFVTVHEGALVHVTTAPGAGVAYLGSILYETGAIDTTVLNETLLAVATTKRLHGEILVEAGHITKAELDEALIEQTCRRIHSLFSLAEGTPWRFESGVIAPHAARDAGRPTVDPLRAAWRGLRERPLCAHVRRTLAKIDGPMQVRDGRMLARYGFAPEELAFASTLVDCPLTLVEALQMSGLSGERTQLVVYALALGRLLGRPRVVAPIPTELGVDGIRARADAIDDEDPCTVLGISKGASAEATRAAYLRLSKLWNPDRLPKELHTVRAECEHVFVRLENAHRVLTERRDRPTPVVKPMSLRMEMPEDEREPMLERKTMRDVDRALVHERFDDALVVARELSIAGTDGPAARAVISWCEARGGAADRDVLARAIVTLDRLLAGDPDCVRALYYRAVIGRRLGQDAQSVKDFRRVVRLDPSHLEAVRELRLHDMRSREMPIAGRDEERDAADTLRSGSGLRSLLAKVSGG